MPRTGRGHLGSLGRGVRACLTGAFAFVLVNPSSAASAEFKSMPLRPEPDPRSGAVTVAPGERVSAQRLERTLRADAAELWRRSDGGVGLSVRIDAVTWRNGALGCPLSDRLYTTAPIEGWRVALTDGTRELTYHASADGRWLLCPVNRSEPPLPGPAVR